MFNTNSHFFLIYSSKLRQKHVHSRNYTKNPLWNVIVKVLYCKGIQDNTFRSLNSVALNCCYSDLNVKGITEITCLLFFVKSRSSFVTDTILHDYAGKNAVVFFSNILNNESVRGIRWGSMFLTSWELSLF